MSRSDCEQIAPLLMPWEAGELNLWTALSVGFHVKRCPDCAAELQELRQMDSLLIAATPFGQEESPALSSKLNRPVILPVAVSLVVLLLIGAGIVRQLSVPTHPVKTPEMASVPILPVKPKSHILPRVSPLRESPPQMAHVTLPVVHHPNLATRPHSSYRVALNHRRRTHQLLARSHPSRRHAIVKPATEPKETFLLIATVPEESFYLEVHTPVKGNSL